MGRKVSGYLVLALFGLPFFISTARCYLVKEDLDEQLQEKDQFIFDQFRSSRLNDLRRDLKKTAVESGWLKNRGDKAALWIDLVNQSVEDEKPSDLWERQESKESFQQIPLIVRFRDTFIGNEYTVVVGIKQTDSHGNGVGVLPCLVMYVTNGHDTVRLENLDLGAEAKKKAHELVGYIEYDPHRLLQMVY